MQWWNNRRGRSEDTPMATGVSSREERLSMYLDDNLSAEELADIEAELERDSDLRSSLEGMAFVRDALRELGTERAPRSFTLVAAQAPRSMRRGYRGGVPRFEVMTRLATAVAAFALMLAVGAPMLTTMVTGDGEDESAAGGVSDTAMSAATAETPGAELMQSMAAPEESPVPDSQPPAPDAPTANDAEGGSGDASGGPQGGGTESGATEERFSDPNGSPAETSLQAADAADGDAADASDDGLDVLQVTQYGLAALTAALLLATGGIYFMRKRGMGFFR